MSMPSCYRIYRYWKDKGITENGEISDTDGVLIIDNPYLPQCWACGMPVDRKSVLSWDKYDLEIEDIWRDKKINSHLDRCHIVGKQFGGSDDPDNLFLMCEECHTLSPDTRNRAAFFRWVYRRKKECALGRNWKKFMEEATEEIRSRGYNPLEFARQFYNLSYREVGSIVDEAMNKCGVHSTAIVDSTVVVALIDTMESRIIAAQKRKLIQREHELSLA